MPKADLELASQIAALFYVLGLPTASERLGWGMGDCKFTSFVPDSCEEASLTLGLQHITSGQPSDKHAFPPLVQNSLALRVLETIYFSLLKA